MIFHKSDTLSQYMIISLSLSLSYYPQKLWYVANCFLWLIVTIAYEYCILICIKRFIYLFLGPFHLTNLLLETMKKTASESNIEGRIVNLSSVLHKSGYKEGIRFDKINEESRYVCQISKCVCTHKTHCVCECL